MNIYEKLVEVRKSVPYLQKGEKGFQFNYVSSSQVLGNLKNKMDELGLLLMPSVTSKEVSEHLTAKGGKEYFTELLMEFIWINAEKPEEQIKCNWYGQGLDSGEKGVGKACTYAEKYFMLKFFNVPTDKDDPDSFQKKHEEKPDKPEVQQKAATQQKLVTQKPVENKPASGPIQWPAFWAGMKKLGYSESEVHAFAKVESLKEWTREMLDELVKDLREAKNKGDKQ